MSRNQQRVRLEQRELQAHDGKFPEISCLPECRQITSQSPKEQKLPTLTSDRKYLDMVSGKSFGSHLLESSWKNAVVKTKKIAQEYASAYGLRNSDEYAAMPSLAQGFEKYPAVSNPSPVAQKTQGAANPFPMSSYGKNDVSCLPPLYLVPSSTSSQYLIEDFNKSRGDIAMGDINKKGTCSWKPGPLKTTGIHGGAGELGALRLKKYNRCSSLISFPEGSKFKPGKYNCQIQLPTFCPARLHHLEGKLNYCRLLAILHHLLNSTLFPLLF
ncbi:putative uncharacterized protein C8orf89 homolog isoform X2 [Hemicordylus capensis]|uniref:putative uncharacterized protein C8orf89 homolog isoform X2 n=1 Tax=Hemicordylus capensis TaxID=884348 RepID=UPI002304C4E2|nr:putative uncharacterized protein C8orf89 homolog isoform X2 [Hemicordylus capensis]